LTHSNFELILIKSSNKSENNTVPAVCAYW